jgi:hypothetical protein
MDEDTPRRRGRPATGVTPKRNIRLGAVWDEAAAAAEQDGETMTAFVDRALRAELRRRARQQGKPAE